MSHAHVTCLLWTSCVCTLPNASSGWYLIYKWHASLIYDMSQYYLTKKIYHVIYGKNDLSKKIETCHIWVWIRPYLCMTSGAVQVHSGHYWGSWAAIFRATLKMGHVMYDMPHSYMTYLMAHDMCHIQSHIENNEVCHIWVRHVIHDMLPYSEPHWKCLSYIGHALWIDELMYAMLYSYRTGLIGCMHTACYIWMRHDHVTWSIYTCLTCLTHLCHALVI